MPMKSDTLFPGFTLTRLAAAIVPSLLAASVATPVLAQGAGILQKVVVVAQKREQSMQDVPIAITSVIATRFAL